MAKNFLPDGICPFHKACLEGMTCGPAIEKRWGEKAIDLRDDPKVWDQLITWLREWSRRLSCFLRRS